MKNASAMYANAIPNMVKRVKDSLFESDEKLFALADTLDEENGPYADLLDHLTRGRVMLGVGPGALPTDAMMIGLDQSQHAETAYQS